MPAAIRCDNDLFWGAGPCGGGASMSWLATATHSSQIWTPGPATSFETSAALFLQNEHRRSQNVIMREYLQLDGNVRRRGPRTPGYRCV
jgi:hypothetical protein